ncbi:hypothetical protein O3M35_011289 [Rhynocoris fuscipes]|uniref:Integrase zinc-binding domain-containing protein n=1 Tax=Rhynocoris fuscipes TaxID=488301 RepID=A0AAW1CWZ9_9HEMI
MPAHDSWHDWPNLQNLHPRADPQCTISWDVDLLIGNDVLPLLLQPGIVPLTSRSPAAFNTTLGWVLYGPFDSRPPAPKQVRFAPGTIFQTEQNHKTAEHHSTSVDSSKAAVVVDPMPENDNADVTTSPIVLSNSESISLALAPLQQTDYDDEELVNIVRRFWEIDRVPDILPFTPEERKCEEIYTQSVSRTASGRYIVPLPFHSHELGVSCGTATRQFLRLEQRLLRQPDLYAAYREFMRDYLESKHMEPVDPNTEPPEYEPYYIPHHAVHRPDDPPTKLRVVFNASCPSSNGKSLNSLLHVGPKLQADISTLLLRFRTHRYVFTADIRQMYRQILVDRSQRDYQRILWRFSSDAPITHFRLNTVTYGVTSAPYLALRTLHQLAADEGDKYPLAKTALSNEIYVDDLLTGCASISDALHLRQELQELLMAGGFELRKWASNHPTLLQDIPPDHCRQMVSEDPLLLDRDPIIKILGLGWNPASDNFFYAVRLSEAANTKRTVLSQMARIFDPLGWLTPITFTAKLFFRKICRLTLDWDQPLPDDIAIAWKEFQDRLPDISQIQVPRLLPELDSNATHLLVGFCDASESGYAASVYLHTTSGHNAHVSLLAAKSKVAPNKSTTLPRLELCGAHLLAKLMSHIMHRMLPALHLSSVAFCDSTVTLAWIRGESHRWKTFVGNRVAEIQELLPHTAWRHVSSQDNPADCASRGLLPHQLQLHPLWWQGPHWLQQHADAWPTTRDQVHNNDEINAELKIIAPATAASTPASLSLIDRYSSLTKLKRVVAFCHRFSYNCRNPQIRRIGFLSASEQNAALLSVVRLTQSIYLSTEKQEALDPASKHRLVCQLRLFIDDHQILRVGGRLSASSLPYNHRHPMLLPKNCHLTNLVIDDAHLRLLHAGALATHSYIRRSFWITDGRNVVRHRIGKCNRCFSVKPRPVIQPMGNLPIERTSAVSAFNVTGVDYAGPFFISSARLRGAVVTKAYLLVFICFASKAVHFELASDLSTASFMAAFQRFVARRGLPATIFSDNGTAFVGAHNKLKELGRLLRHPSHQQAICDTASTLG